MAALTPAPTNLPVIPFKEKPLANLSPKDLAEGALKYPLAKLWQQKDSELVTVGAILVIRFGTNWISGRCKVDEGLQSDVVSLVEDLVTVEVGDVEEVSVEPESPRIYRHIKVSDEVYRALLTLKKRKRLTWDGLFIWLMRVAKAKKKEVKCVEEEKEMDLGQVLQLISLFTGGK